MIPMRTLLFFALSSLIANAQSHWVVTWGTSPAPLPVNEREAANSKLEFANQTIREIVHTSIGGTTIRVRLSNAYGRSGAEIAAAHIALHAKGPGIVPESDRALTFSGRSSVIIPPDAQVVSDPVELNVPPASDLAISLYLPKRINAAGIHYGAQQTSYIGPANMTASVTIGEPVTFSSWAYLAGVDVLAPEDAFAIAAFGDSISDGTASGTDTNARWPDVLATRLLAGHKPIGVLNAAIAGNRLLHDATFQRFGVNALARFDRDVLAAPGVKYVIVLEGINDLGMAGASSPEDETVSADDLIAAYKQLIARAHEHGLRIIGGTLTPFAVTTFRGYFTPEKEVKRKAVNQWIRTSGAFDGVIDFEQAVRDPANPEHMLPAYDSGDHLHPKAAGYQVMGQSIDLGLFQKR